MSNVSVIGEKFVFSKFLEPVSESQMEKEIKEIDSWLEANNTNNTDEDSKNPISASDVPDDKEQKAMDANLAKEIKESSDIDNELFDESFLDI